MKCYWNCFWLEFCACHRKLKKIFKNYFYSCFIWINVKWHLKYLKCEAHVLEGSIQFLNLSEIKVHAEFNSLFKEISIYEFTNAFFKKENFQTFVGKPICSNAVREKIFQKPFRYSHLTNYVLLAVLSHHLFFIFQLVLVSILRQRVLPSAAFIEYSILFVLKCSHRQFHFFMHMECNKIILKSRAERNVV